MLRHVQPAPENIVWQMNREEFEECLPPSESGLQAHMTARYRCAGRRGTRFLLEEFQRLSSLRSPTSGIRCQQDRVHPPKSKNVDANGRQIRPPETRPSTLCNGDCEIPATAMRAELRKYSQDCIHPSHRCVSQRIMTDNIFESETAASAHCACSSDGCGFLLADFACTYLSVEYRSIFRVLQRAGVTEF